MKKRNLLLGSLLILSLLFISPLISAASWDFDNARDKIIIVSDNFLGILAPVFEQIIGDYSGSDLFFSKVLLLILLIIITTNIIGRTPIGENNKKVNFILGAIISILAIRYMNSIDFFEAILIQYGVLGIAITTILPMVIFFYFIHNTKIGTFGRKVFWAIYAIALTAIWISKSEDIPEVANWIYGLVILATIIFIFMDKSIHVYFGLAGFHKFKKKSKEESIKGAKRELNQAKRDLADGIIDIGEFGKIEREIEWKIKVLSKD